MTAIMHSDAIRRPVPDGAADWGLMARSAVTPWMELVEAGLEYRADFTRKWAMFQRAYELNHNIEIKKAAYGDFVTTGIGKATIDGIRAATALHIPTFNVEHRDPSASAAAAMLLAQWWLGHGMQGPFWYAWGDALLCGNGYLKVSWNHQDRTHEAGTAQIAQEIARMAQERAATDPGNAAGSWDSINSDMASRLSAGWGQSTTIEASHPRLLRVDPWDMVLDPSAPDSDSCEWLCQMTRRLVSEVRADERYDSTVRRQVKPQPRRTPNASTWPEGSEDDTEGRRAGDTPTGSEQRSVQRYVDVYEFWHKPSNTVATWAEGQLAYLRPPEPAPYAAPYVHLPIYRLQNKPYAMGEMEAILSLEEELDELRTQLNELRRAAIPKVVARASVFASKENREALNSRRANALIKIPAASHDGARGLNDFVRIEAPPEAPWQLYQDQRVILDDIDRSSGWSEQARGVVASSRQTATEIATLQDNLEGKLSEKHSLVAQAAGKVGQMMLEMGGKMLAQPVEVRTGDGLRAVTAEQLDPNMLVNVVAGSMAMAQSRQRRAEVAEVLEIVAPLAAAQVIDMSALARWVVAKAGIDPAAQIVAPSQGAGVGSPPNGPIRAPGSPVGAGMPQ